MNWADEAETPDESRKSPSPPRVPAEAPPPVRRDQQPRSHSHHSSSPHQHQRKQPHLDPPRIVSRGSASSQDFASGGPRQGAASDRWKNYNADSKRGGGGNPNTAARGAAPSNTGGGGSWRSAGSSGPPGPSGPSGPPGPAGGGQPPAPNQFNRHGSFDRGFQRQGSFQRRDSGGFGRNDYNRGDYNRGPDYNSRNDRGNYNRGGADYNARNKEYNRAGSSSGGWRSSERPAPSVAPVISGKPSPSLGASPSSPTHKSGSSDARRRNDSASSRDRGASPPPALSYGVVTSLKDKFGFLQTVSEKQPLDVFFHFDQTERNMCDPSKLKVGDEVSFEMVFNRNNRVNATRMKLLERGSVSYDKTVKKGLNGVILYETVIPPKRDVVVFEHTNASYQTGGNQFLESKYNPKYFQGRVLVVSDEDLAKLDKRLLPEGATMNGEVDDETVISFGARGLGNTNLSALEGSTTYDVVRSDEKKTGSEKDEATKVDSPETKRIFPTRGDLVKFDLGMELATGEYHAINMTIVKRGCVRRGNLIDIAIKSSEAKRERGRVRALANSFGLMECEERGDKVYFSYLDLPEKLRPKKKDSDAEGKKKKSKTQPEDWRNDEKRKDSTELHVGAEFEFNVVTDPMNPDRLLAVKMTAIPEGSVTFEKCVASGVKGTVSKWERKNDEDGMERRHKGVPPEMRERVPYIGSVRLHEPIVDDDAASKEGEEGKDFPLLEFGGDDLVMPGPRPMTGDTIVLDVYKLRRTGELFARSVQLFCPAEEKERVEADPIDVWKGNCIRETGIVNIVRDSFGFIECMDRPGHVFFPLKEVVALRAVVPSQGEFKPQRSVREVLLKVGDPVSFQVCENQKVGIAPDKRTFAARVMKLNSPLSKEIILKKGVCGLVLRMPTKGSSNSRKRGGRGGNSSGKSESVTELGVIRADPVPTVAPELFEVLSKFHQDELLASSGGKPALCIEIIVKPAPNSAKTNKYTNAKSKDSKKQKGETAPSSTTSRENPFTLQITNREEKVLRDYCNWFGLRVDTIKGATVGDEPSATVVKAPILKKKATADAHNNANSNSATTTPRLMNVQFSTHALIDRRTHVEDKVQFNLIFDKKTFQHLAKSIKVTEQAKRKPPVVERRANTEVGIVSALHNQGFGFIQSADRSERLFFHVADCDGNYRAILKSGDEVEYEYVYSANGSKAVSVRVLPKGVVIVDDPLIDPATKQVRKGRGFVIREAKGRIVASSSTSNPSNPKADHPNSLRISQVYAPKHTMGRIQVAFTNNTKQEESWRAKPRVSEVQGLLRKFKDDEDRVVWEVNQDDKYPLDKLKDLAREASSMGLVVLWLKDDLIIGRTRESVTEYQSERKRKAQEATEDDSDDSDSESDSEHAKQAQIKNRNQKDAANKKDAKDEEKQLHNQAVYLFTSADVAQPEPEERKEEQQESSGDSGKDKKDSKQQSATKRWPRDEGSTKKWFPQPGDEVEFELCVNRATKEVRATKVRLVNSGVKKSRGVVEGQASGRQFVRPLKVTEGMDESFKPGGGGRDGTIAFDRGEVKDGIVLCDGDEVEYSLVVNPRTKEAKATRVKLIKRAPMPEVSNTPGKNTPPPTFNREALKHIKGATSAISGQAFHSAKGPDGTRGFPAGRGRNLPRRTKLRVTAKEFKPNF